MVTKTKGKAREHKYIITSAGGGQKTIIAQNIQEAYAKAKNLFPRAKIVTVSRRPAHTGKEYETYIINRHKR